MSSFIYKKKKQTLHESCFTGNHLFQKLCKIINSKGVIVPLKICVIQIIILGQVEQTSCHALQNDSALKQRYDTES